VGGTQIALHLRTGCCWNGIRCAEIDEVFKSRREAFNGTRPSVLWTKSSTAKGGSEPEKAQITVEAFEPRLEVQDQPDEDSGLSDAGCFVISSFRSIVRSDRTAKADSGGTTE